MNGIGKRLRQERKRLKLTQSALGAIGGVEANAQGHYESGQRLPRADYLFKIAAAGVDITRVVTGVDASARAELPAFSTTQTSQNSEGEGDLDSSESMVKIISQLRQSLWITANALCEVTRLVDSEERRSIARDLPPDAEQEMDRLSEEFYNSTEDLYGMREAFAVNNRDRFGGG